MGLLDTLFNNKPAHESNFMSQPMPDDSNDDSSSNSMTVDPNKPLPEYEKLPPVVFGNG